MINSPVRIRIKLTLLEVCLYSALMAIISVLLLVITRQSNPILSQMLAAVTTLLLIVTGLSFHRITNEASKQAQQRLILKNARTQIVSALKRWAAGSEETISLMQSINLIKANTPSAAEKVLMNELYVQLQDHRLPELAAQEFIIKLLEMYIS